MERAPIDPNRLITSISRRVTNVIVDLICVQVGAILSCGGRGLPCRWHGLPEEDALSV